MIPNQPHINPESVRSMLIQCQAQNCSSYKFPMLENLDDDCLNLLDPEYNHELIEQLLTETWIHFDPLLPDPELDKALWELVKLVSKYDLKDEGKQE